MGSTEKRVAVVGCGPAGLVSIKTALEHGFLVTGFEANGVIGGLWNYEAFKTDLGYEPVDHYDKPISGIYKSLLLNTSKEISAFSDFPNKDAKSSFLNHWEFLDYQKRYANNFKLLDHIKLNTPVTKVRKDKDKWIVQYQSAADEKTVEETFDFVMLATGCFKFPNMPVFKGLSDKYQGIVLHSTQVRDEVIFKDKRVLIIGGGYSGCEVAVGAINNDVGKIFFCFTNDPQSRNHWAMDRWVEGSHGEKAPWDHAVTRYEYFENPDKFGVRMRSWLNCTHSKDGKEELRFPGDRLALTDVNLIQSNLKLGKIEKVAPIAEFFSNGVELTDGTRLDNIDFVVMGTGFIQRYPMIDDLWEPSNQVKCELYKYVLHPDPSMDGLGFVCAAPSPLPLFPIMEMQARWICSQVYKRSYDTEGQLFTASERELLRDDVRATRKAQPDDVPYNYLVDGPGYVDKLSQDVGCAPPSFDDLAKCGDHSDIELAVALRYGPIIGPHYRIRGPGSWNGAKDWVIKVAKSSLGEEKFKELVMSTKI